MKGIARYLVLAAIVAATTLDGGVSAPREANEAVSVHVNVHAARRVADLDRRRLERAVIVGLTSAERCPIRLVEEAKDATIRVDLHLKKWLDRSTPDGVWRYDPRTGREVPGMKYEVWGVYDLEIRLAGRDKPIEQEKDESFRSAERENRNPLFDAQARALDEAHGRIVSDIRREVCEQAREGVSSSRGKP